MLHIFHTPIHLPICLLPFAILLNYKGSPLLVALRNSHVLYQRPRTPVPLFFHAAMALRSPNFVQP